MTIQFSEISQSVRASNIFIELAGVKRSLASLFIKPCGLIIGQYDPAKTSIVDNIPIKVSSADDVASKAGSGSHAHRQALRLPPSVFLQGNGVYWVPVTDGAAAAAATENITITGAATSNGTLYFQIGGDLIEVGVTSGDAFGDIAAAIQTAMTAKPNLPASGVATLGVCAVTSKFKGLSGNQILIKVNPAGETQEDKNPTGVTVALSNVDGYLSGGSVDPSVEDVFFTSDGIDKLGDRWYTACTMPFTDATNIGFHVASGELRSEPGTNRFFASYGGYTKETYAQALALPASTNSEWVGEIWENRYEAPAFELAAELVGIILDEQNAAPNRPYKTLELSGAADADTVNRRYDENDALFRAGMSYCTLDSTGSLRLGDIALTRRTTDGGGVDTEEWFDAVTLHLRQAKAYSIEQIWSSDDYARSVVTDDDAPPTAVSFAKAPKDFVAELTKLVEDLWGRYTWSKNVNTVIASISAEINAGNNSRIDNEIVDDDAKALRIVATRYAYLY